MAHTLLTDEDPEDRQVALDDPCVPETVRRAVLARMQPGDTLWRCPRASAPQGPLGLLGMGRRTTVIEWWLIDAQGDLIEAFWEQ